MGMGEQYLYQGRTDDQRSSGLLLLGAYRNIVGKIEVIAEFHS
jgi:hypothetical protein